jgi:hypothetical protein
MNIKSGDPMHKLALIVVMNSDVPERQCIAWIQGQLQEQNEFHNTSLNNDS